MQLTRVVRIHTGKGRAVVIWGSTSLIALTLAAPALASSAHPQSPIEFGEPVVSAGLDLDRVGVGDLDGDGDLDLVAADYETRHVTLARGGTDGSFDAVGSQGVGLRVSDLAVADLNGDPYADVIVSDWDARKFAILTGQAGFELGEPVYYPLRGKPFVPRPVDLDGDSDLDLVVRATKMPLLLMENDGNASFSVRATMRPFSINQFTDVDHDDDMDLVGFAPNDRVENHRIVIARGLGDWTFGDRTKIWMGRDHPHEPTTVTAADLNGDGTADLVTTNRDGGTLGVRLGREDRTYGPLHREVVGGAPSRVAPVDLDADGWLDLVVRDEARILVLRGTGDGRFEPAQTIDDGLRYPRAYAFVVDVDRDGRSDLILSDQYAPDSVSTVLNTSGDEAVGSTS